MLPAGTHSADCGCDCCAAHSAAAFTPAVTSATSALSTSFVLHGAKWGAPDPNAEGGLVYWAFGRGLGALNMKEAAYLNAVRAAFDAWEAVADIEFVETTASQASIVVAWDDIDGPNGFVGVTDWNYTITSASFNTMIDAKIRFDTADFDRAATDLSSDNFYATAVHEVGHAIGLGHIDNPSQIMYAYIGSIDSPQDGDVTGAQYLYGAPDGVLERSGTGSADALDFSGIGQRLLIDAFGGDDMIFGGANDDDVNGGRGNDRIDGGGGDDHITDPEGNDTISGGSGDDMIFVFSGENRIFGERGQDVLLGGYGNDRLSGGGGHDLIVGDAAAAMVGGCDHIIGGRGNDLLMGGLGPDVFVFRPRDGADRIAAFNIDEGGNTATEATVMGIDFELGADRIKLVGFDLHSVSDVRAALSDKGGNAVFSAEGTTITIEGIKSAMLEDDAFIF